MVLPRFLTELKRRKVYRTALVYAGVGWVLLEVADVAFPRLGLPDWTVNLVLALVLLGFPLAIVFAWIFDFSPQGLVRTQPISPEAHHHRFYITSIVEFALIVVLVVTVGYLYVERLSMRERLVQHEAVDSGKPAIPRPDQYRAIAVLPFADMSEAGDQAWFAEGIAEELLIALSQVEELHVMARTSSFAFRDTDKTIAEIADILGVQAVLEGSVRRSGDRVRISAQLVDASNGYRLWSGSYERQLTDIFKLQDELAKSVVQALSIELGVDISRTLVAEQTLSLEAYSWFIRGRALFDWANPKVLYQTESNFEKAVEADPDYALAWGYLSFVRMAMMLFRPFDEVGPPAIAAYERALALDPEQSQSLAAKALMTQLLEHDWEAAGRLYQRAMTSKDNGIAMLAYAVFYLPVIDKEPLAIRLYTDGERVDPRHAGYKANHAALLYWNGHNEGAIHYALEAFELNPRHQNAITYLIMAYVETGNYAAVQQLLESLPAPLQDAPRIKAAVGLYHAASGDEEKAREIYRELLANPPPGGPFFISVLALGLGEVEECIDLMERLVVEKRFTQFWSRTLFRNHEILRDHPRYLALLKRIGLDDESIAELHSRMSFD
jgi:TolB-like protein/cytochrome c-type biogenesis protein CcmH/NrfG